MRAKYVTVLYATGTGVAERWKAQYCRDGNWRQDLPFNPEFTYDSLRALGTNPDIRAVAGVIGNKSWSYLRCNGCSEYFERTVRIGENEDSGNYCETCIREAYAILGTV